MSIDYGGRRKLTRREMEAAEKKRVLAPVIVQSKSSRLITVPVNKLGELIIDERYQREMIRDEVNDIAHALRNGGSVPAPIHIAERPDGTLAIVDGQQRWWAHVDVDMPIKAFVHKVKTFEQEEELYDALNTFVKPSALNAVKAGTGPLSKIIHQWNDDHNSPMYQRINLGHNSGRPYDGSILARGIFIVIAPHMQRNWGGMKRILRRATIEWEKYPTVAKKKAEGYLDLVSEIWQGPPRVRFSCGVALARICARKWEGGKITFPSKRSVSVLRRINWEHVSQGTGKATLYRIQQIIEEKWS